MTSLQSLRSVVAATAMAVATPFTVGQAIAAPSETGFHKIHATARAGGKVCMIDHFHEQDGLSLPSRHGAEASAIRQWITFTADEYGSAWGSFTAAGSKKVNCKQGGDKSWTCSALARPCKSGK